MRIYHILLQHKHEAEDVFKLIEGGLDRQNAAEKFSLCQSRQNGGLVCDDSHPRWRARLDPDFVDAVDLIKDQEVSKPVRTRFGYHLIWINY